MHDRPDELLGRRTIAPRALEIPLALVIYSAVLNIGLLNPVTDSHSDMVCPKKQKVGVTTGGNIIMELALQTISTAGHC